MVSTKKNTMVATGLLMHQRETFMGVAAIGAAGAAAIGADVWGLVMCGSAFFGGWR